MQLAGWGRLILCNLGQVSSRAGPAGGLSASQHGLQGAGRGAFSARRRHLDALDKALVLVDTGRKQLQASGAGELLAEICARHKITSPK